VLVGTVAIRSASKGPMRRFSLLGVVGLLCSRHPAASAVRPASRAQDHPLRRHIQSAGPRLTSRSGKGLEVPLPTSGASTSRVPVPRATWRRRRCASRSRHRGRGSSEFPPAPRRCSAEPPARRTQLSYMSATCSPLRMTLGHPRHAIPRRATTALTAPECSPTTVAPWPGGGSPPD
jgi:hypothetical protein